MIVDSIENTKHHNVQKSVDITDITLILKIVSSIASLTRHLSAVPRSKSLTEQPIKFKCVLYFKFPATVTCHHICLDHIWFSEASIFQHSYVDHIHGDNKVLVFYISD